MAWDFSTEPEFQEQLDWMRDSVREEIWPIETVFDELGQAGFERVIAPLREQVKERGLWAAHLPPDLGGQGFGQVKLGLMHEILGSSVFAPSVFGNAAPDSGNSEILAMAGTQDQKDQYLYPLLNGDIRSAFSMTEPETAGSDPTLLQTRAELDGDEWVINGHKWFSSNASVADFLIVMAVTDPEAQTYQRASMLVVPADTPGVTIVRDIATMEHPYEHFGRDRKSTRLNSSHLGISYAVFCLKKKKLAGAARHRHVGPRGLPAGPLSGVFHLLDVLLVTNPRLLLRGVRGRLRDRGLDRNMQLPAGSTLFAYTARFR